MNRVKRLMGGSAGRERGEQGHPTWVTAEDLLGALAAFPCAKVTGGSVPAGPGGVLGRSPSRAGNVVDERQRGTHKEPGFKSQIPTVLKQSPSPAWSRALLSPSPPPRLTPREGWARLTALPGAVLFSSCPSWLGLRHAEHYTAVSWSSRWIIW